MKHAELRAVVHSLADSLASGCSLLTGFYELDVFADAARSAGGAITVNFLDGEIIEGAASPMTAQAVRRAAAVLPTLCAKAGGDAADLAEAKAHFWWDQIERRFAITIADSKGRRSTTEYFGIPAKRKQMLDALGRRRPKPSFA